jgi:hypothetical protein
MAVALQVTNLPVGTNIALETSALKSGALALIASGTLADAQYATMNATTGSLAAGAVTGAKWCYLLTTNATPGVQRVRTAAQMLADIPNGAAGMVWTARVINSGAGTFTLTADAGATVTISGTATVPTNTFRDFMFTLNTATTATAQSVGSGAI